ncbi:hypothetical protein PC129_g5762 [Phytophthora cactorum]|uniref:Uncharacterized protein n=1 Tax=Phytophthora cactorum TaxID=29920 RepID=A0A8T1IIT8_9STRA|nr:hypothetical protein PC114_g1986 [Phytophthora cactorum]KAG3223568.1 hypothetical protein PC129_g5762 [Phytophthora cactorum]
MFGDVLAIKPLTGVAPPASRMDDHGGTTSGNEAERGKVVSTSATMLASQSAVFRKVCKQPISSSTAAALIAFVVVGDGNSGHDLDGHDNDNGGGVEEHHDVCDG